MDLCLDGCELFRFAKQRVGERKDVVGVSCLNNECGAVIVSMDDRKKNWKEHMERLMSIEGEWSDGIEASKVKGAVKRTEVEEVQFAMNPTKIQKASGSPGVAIELLKANGDKCLKSLINKFNDFLFKKKLPEEWMLSSLVPIFKGKGDPLNPNSYRGIKLLGFAFKLYQKVLKGCLHKVVDIVKIQYGFIPGRGAANVVFVLRRLSSKFRAKDWVPRKLFVLL